MTYTITIPGQPVPKGRPRYTKFGHTYTPEKTRKQEALVKRLYKGPKFENAISIICLFYMPIPKSWSKKKIEQALNGEIRHTSRPDTDNMCKLVMDALNKTAWLDDSQIDSTVCKKFYSDNPKTVVIISEANNEDV